jgi:hypothetical protein
MTSATPSNLAVSGVHDVLMRAEMDSRPSQRVGYGTESCARSGAKTLEQSDLHASILR